MGAGRGHFERPLDVLLPLDVLEVHGVAGRGDELPRLEAAGRDFAGVAEKPDDPDEVLEAIDVEVADERRLPGVRARNDDPRKPGFLGEQGDGQDAAHGFEAPVEGQLAGEEIVAQAGRRDDLQVGQKTEGDGQVEGRALLPPIGGGEVDGDPFRLHVVAAILEGGPDAFLALPDGGVGQTDRDERREAGADIDLDLDGKSLDPVKGGACDLEQHGT